jgi:hypothetical protein
MNTYVYIKIPRERGFVTRIIEINSNKDIRQLKAKMVEEIPEVNDLAFTLKTEDGRRILYNVIIENMMEYDADDGTLYLTLEFQVGGGRRYKKKEKKTKKYNNKKKSKLKKHKSKYSNFRL